MKKDSIIDYTSCILLRTLGPILRSLPFGCSHFLGRRLGDLFYYFDLKHKSIAYANIKTAFGDKLPPQRINSITKGFYRNFCQSLIEVFLIPLVDKEYIRKYVEFQGLDYIAQALRRGRGIIFVAVHEGSWELYNVIAANIGHPFSLLVSEQERFPRLENLLNSYRRQKGCRIIQKHNQKKELIRLLKRNEIVAMTADQGARAGELVRFFNRSASMATGAIRFALKYDTAIIPAFYIRKDGPYARIIIDSVFEIKKTANPQKDIHDNLERLISVFEKHISGYPEEYLWTYKIWKYGRERNILILKDGKTGHLRQAQSAADIISNYLKEKGLEPRIDTAEIRFKNKISQKALIFSSLLAGKYHCQGCLWCLKTFLQKDVFHQLLQTHPDVVVSCGSSTAAINFILSRETLARSIAILKPSILSTGRFNLVIMPRHDNPPMRKNVVVTEGALNLINEKYLEDSIAHIAPSLQADRNRLVQRDEQRLTMGLLIGGDTKDFRLKAKTISEVIKEIKAAAEKLDADILVTTSRRTSQEIEAMVKREFNGYAACKLLIIANENNIPSAVGGILGLSQIIVVSPESISMISEAATSKRYVLVFKSAGLGKKHRWFIDNLVRNKYIYLVSADTLCKSIQDLWQTKHEISVLRDNLLVKEAIRKII